MLKVTLGLSLLVLVAAVPAFAQTFAPAAVVVDAKGQEVGPYFPITQYGPELVLTTQDFALVRISTSPEIQTLLPVGPNGFGAAEGYYGSILYYTTSNCSGTAYMRPTAGGLTLPTVSYGIVGDVLYYPPRTAPEKITSPSGVTFLLQDFHPVASVRCPLYTLLSPRRSSSPRWDSGCRSRSANSGTPRGLSELNRGCCLSLHRGKGYIGPV